MKTRMMDLHTEWEEALAAASACLLAGEVVAFPTETVYGLGARSDDAEAVRRIFLAKGRPADNPLIVHVSHMEQARRQSRRFSDHAERLAAAFWPGPLSIVVDAASHVPSIVTAGLDSVALRMPSHPDARALIERAGTLAAPSANRSGRPSPVTAAHVLEDMDGIIPLILDGGTCQVGVESTVVDARGPVPILLRPGGVTREQIAHVCGGCNVAQGVFEPVTGQALSPGMLHKHYAPNGQATLFWPGPHTRDALCAAYDEAQHMGMRPVIVCGRAMAQAIEGRDALVCDDEGSMAHGLFSALREADRIGAQRILIQGVELTGTGMAYMNRALRAAGFDVEREEAE